MASITSGLQAFYDELKRRHVFRVAAAYVVGAFFVLEAANLVFEGLLVPDWVYRGLTVLTLAGFPVVLVLSWLFQWTSAGIRREEAMPAPVEQPAVAGPTRSTPGAVRAYAFIGLALVVVLVVTGLSVPYVYSQREHQSSLEGQREGISLASNDGTARLAVLPFASLTGDDDAGFADGLAEDITATLAQVGGVDVISRTTSESYRDSEKTAREIGAELGVGLILEGTIRRAGDRVRVTVQLIDARTDRHLWANSYDRELSGDVFGTQSQLAQEIVAAIQSVMTGETDQAESRLLALGLTEEGDELLSRADPAYDEAAEELFEQALAKDSVNPVAHAGIAQTLVTRAQGGGPPALLDSAAHHARLAIRLAPELADAHAAQAFVYLMQGEMDSMQVSLRRAVDLDDSGEAFEVEWQERIRMISPEALERARRTLVETASGARFEVFETPPVAPTAPVSGTTPVNR